MMHCMRQSSSWTRYRFLAGHRARNKHNNKLSDGKGRQHRTGQQKYLGGRRYPVRASVTVIGGPRARHAAPSWYSELRWIAHESEKKTAKVTITATGQLCCTQQLVGDPGVPVATSRFLVLSRRDSSEAQFPSRSQIILLLDLASPSGSSGTIFLPTLVPSILSEHNRSR
ncbi:hypothetical protein BJV77DRAFT_773779 [Russula vinacea]|nr:hypothetical protein BJV77DRAFT_773779 [Russula vinacea]